MTDNDKLLEVLEACERRREERRAFLRSGSSAAIAAAGAGLLAGCFGGGDNDAPPPPPPPPPTSAPPPPATGTTDGDILNFALNLEYLEAQFYFFAAYGRSLPESQLGGTGTRGQVSGGRKVNFTDPQVADYAREIAQDEAQHVVFLRQALGASAVAQPALDIGSGPNSAFSAAARSAGLIGAGQSFDPYANDENFLLGAYIFEDVGVTAYKGASPLITSKVFLEAAAGILAAEAYHAGLIRTVLYRKGMQTPALITATERISDARDSLDDPSDKDQGVAQRGQQSNIVPSDSNGLAFSRSAGDVLNIVYLTAAAASQGGFFPAGLNGAIRTSTAN